ncbi:hypothetical protein MMC20_007508 [Loxospora ochrophaea]|nr:hypothetical protein [Loxospora ochrophaea]
MGDPGSGPSETLNRPDATTGAKPFNVTEDLLDSRIGELTTDGQPGDESWEEMMDWDDPTEVVLLEHKSSNEGEHETAFPQGAPSGVDRSGHDSYSKSYTQLSAPLAATEAVAQQASGKRNPHNIVEKRYRTNLNAKIARLRDSVPSLRPPSKRRSIRDPRDYDDLDGIDASADGRKLNKSTVLTRAIEYIRELEERNERLEKEVTRLKGRLENVQTLQHEASSVIFYTKDTQSHTLITKSADTGTDGGPKVETEEALQRPKSPEGLIRVPEDIRRLRSVSFQPHYAAIVARNGVTGHDSESTVILDAIGNLT